MTASIMYTEAGRHERALSSPVSEAALFSSVLLAVDFTSPSLGAARWGASHVAASADATLAHVIPFSDADAGSPSAECIQQREAALAGSLRGFGTTRASPGRASPCASAGPRTD